MTISREGNGFILRNEAGQQAAITGAAIAANNGTLIAIDRVLVDPERLTAP